MDRGTHNSSGAPLDRVLRAPPSKSVTHRALVAAALASGESTIVEPLDAVDTQVTRAGLAALGVPIEVAPGSWRVGGRGGAIPGGAELSLSESGTSLRFLLAVASLSARPSRLDGSSRLRQRPIRELATALGELGARVRLAAQGAGLPLVAGGELPAGGAVRIPSGRSSQFASALLLVGPALPRGLDLTLESPAVSLPYVELTATVLQQFGARVERLDRLRWRVGPGGYPGGEIVVDGDHSSSSYLLAAAAIVGGRVRVEGIDPQSAQPDRRFAEVLEGLGCEVRRGVDWIEVAGSGRLPGFDLDMAEAPDLVPTLAALALFAEGPCTVSGVGHLRLKESDRLELLARNLTALGRPSHSARDRLEIGPPAETPRGCPIVTGSDHRIAMAFAVAGLRVAGISLDDTDCVAKSDPGFWERFEALRR